MEDNLMFSEKNGINVLWKWLNWLLLGRKIPRLKPVRLLSGLTAKSVRPDITALVRGVDDNKPERMERPTKYDFLNMPNVMLFIMPA